MYIGKRVQELRKVRGMSLTELAEKSGVQIAGIISKRKLHKLREKLLGSLAEEG